MTETEDLQGCANGDEPAQVVSKGSGCGSSGGGRSPIYEGVLAEAEDVPADVGAGTGDQAGREGEPTRPPPAHPGGPMGAPLGTSGPGARIPGAGCHGAMRLTIHKQKFHLLICLNSASHLSQKPSWRRSAR
jgi:hypothetical protein